MADLKDLSRDLRRAERRYAPIGVADLDPARNYLDDRLRSVTENQEAQVIALLVWDKGRTRINCYLGSLDEKEVIRELNLSHVHHVHYPSGPSGIPNLETYRHGVFVPTEQRNQDRKLVSRFKMRNGVYCPVNSYVALGKSIPAENLDNLVVIPF
ncbi:hypothetical protein COY27_02520 [Candidatus Woesearchaeota archaeon CG_4_10_14_0_2_um_filter_33_13]|nr:MAG: hypothetical protein COY27_02520 [Candidatus Woesearchaeota archaeon CG_4_10_14_0_2_um_filter_33_13]